MITTEIKNRILETIKLRRPNFTSDSKMAVMLGINTAQFSRIRNGELDNVLSEANWISIARKLDVQLGNKTEVVTAITPVFDFITKQLAACQYNSLCGLLCDLTDIGKTYAACIYVKGNKNAVYIDCSQVKTKQKLVRQIAKEFGLTNTGRYADVYDDVVFYIRSIPNPMVILDEAGDLDYAAFLELKALWNATEYTCGWYMMGADSLKAKIENNLNRRKVGYAEIFRRYGSRYQRISPAGKAEMDEFTRQQIAMVGKANGITDIQKLHARTGGSLTRVRTEIQKLKTA
jgi:DNA transposition AAA+ family ATPase